MRTQAKLAGAVAMVVVAAGLTPAAATTGGHPTMAPTAQAKKADRARDARALRTIYTNELGLDHPTGIAWDRDRRMLLVTGPEKAGTEVVGVSPDEQRRSRRLLPTVDTEGTPAFDPRADRLTMLAHGRRVVVGPRVARKSWPSKAAARALRRLDPAGATYSRNGGLHVLDARRQAIVHVSPRGKVTRTAVKGLDHVALRGIAYEQPTGTFYVADADAENLYQVTRSGEVATTWDLAGAGISDLQAMTLAPSGDNTDAPAEQSLYVVDNGSADQLGSVTEITLRSVPVTQVDAGYSIEPTMTAAHATSTWSPPSPDPSGVTNLPGEGLLVSDGEVEEMPLYAGTNLWVAKTDGTTTGKTGTTHMAFSDEPTGVEYRPSDGHLFVSDDTSPTAVYELSGPGSDRIFGTADDPAPSMLRTSAFAATDPEGVAYDSKRDDVLISDGLSDELYRVDLGADHVFSSDDVVTHQDLEVLGIFDPEGIVYDAERDTVVVVDDTAIWELDENASLLGKVGISSLRAKAPAGITIAPASDGSNARNYYIVARGVDNNSDPSENDGMMYEVAADVPQITNRPPTADAGPDQAIDLGDVAQLSGVATDDGRPNGTLSYRWSVRSGPGSVSFGTPTSKNTTATFSAVGSYVLRLTVSDSSLSVYDEVTVSVYQVGDLRTATIRLGAGSDDAREGTAVGGDFVNLARAHDMLGQDFDPSTGTWFPITTGIRFPGLPVPHGGQVVSARIQFESYQADVDPASVTFRGEASDNATPYQSVGGNVSSRPDTIASVAWSPAAWTAAGQAGAAQLSPDLSAILQEIVDRPGWSAGNAAALTVTGTGRRTGKSYETNGGPVLQLEYRTTKPVNQAPTVNAGLDATVTLPGAATLDGTVSDDGLPNPPGAVTTTWSKVSGPGTVTFVNAAAVDTTASFSAAGSYVLRLTGDDSALGAFDEVTVTVNPANQAPTVNAGVDATVSLPGAATLDGTVSDDGWPKPPGAVTTTWSKVSGPGTVSFGDAAAVDTSASFSAAGSYVLRLAASDGALGGSDEVAVTVHPANQAPTVNAGLDATVTLPGAATLDGTVSDDGWPKPPGAVTTTWSKVSGPGTVSFGDAAGVDTTASFSAAGSYVLRLAASDGALGGSDEVAVTVHPANQAPTVNAGLDATVTLPGAATLDGTVSDDGLPNPPGAVTTTWSKVSGPGTVTFVNAAAVDTSASFSAAGSYVLRLTASDSALSASDEVTITVSPAVPANQAPRVNAGADATVTLPSSVALDGTVSDDGLPNPPGAVTTTWSKVSGPGTVSFGNVSAVDTRASFSAAGSYVLRLTGTDSARSASDDVRVVVKERPQARLAVSVFPNPLRVGRTARITGTLSPDPDGRLVRLQRWSGSGWRTTDTRALAAGQERFAFAVTPSRSARFVYRVVAPRTGAYDAIGSGKLVLRVHRARIRAVRPRPDVVVVENTGRVRIDLEGWVLRNRRTARQVPLPTLLVGPHRRVRIHTGRGQSDRNDLYLGRRAMWGRHGAAILRDQSRALVARLRY